MLTKEEMEDIWNNRPIGYLKSRMSEIKKLKNYVCEVKPYKWIYGTKDNFAVRSINQSTAEFAAIEMYKTKYPSEEWVDFKVNVKLQ